MNVKLNHTKIAKILKDKKVTKTELVYKCSVSSASVSEIDKVDKCISAITAVKICNHLGVKLEDVAI